MTAILNGSEAPWIDDGLIQASRRKPARYTSVKLPLQITFRNKDPSDAMQTDVREKAEKLDHFYDQIMSCRVMIEAHHKHHRDGSLYHVRTHLKGLIKI